PQVSISLPKPMENDNEMKDVQNKPMKNRKTTKERIEEAQYDIKQDMLTNKADISFWQLIKLVPGLLTHVNQRNIKSFAIKDRNRSDFNVFVGEDEAISALALVEINDYKIQALVDCGASKAIINKSLLDQLGYEIDAPSTTTFVIGDNSSYASLGVV
ncbi:hypothetical protein BD560DRAFT_304228, partial [Blakeslea trispora]